MENGRFIPSGSRLTACI